MPKGRTPQTSMSQRDLLFAILERTSGMTKEELAKAIGSNTHTVRALISNMRNEGIWIVDSLVPGNVFWTKKKEYFITTDAQVYYEWGIRQQGGSFKPLGGAPRA